MVEDQTRLPSADGLSAPYGGPHRVDNGLLLHADLDILFDQGYITITPEYRVVVSERISSEFDGATNYSSFSGKNLLLVPDNPRERPSAEFIAWHNQNVFLDELTISAV